VIDYDVIAALAEREPYERFHKFVNKSALTEDAYAVFSAMGEWFANNPNDMRIQWPAFSAWFLLVRHAKMPKQKLAAMREILGVIAEKDVNDVQVSAGPLIQGLTRREYAAKVADLALRISDGDHSVDFGAIGKLLAEYDAASGRFDAAERFIGQFSAEVLESTSGPGLEWRLSESLGKGAGPIRQGDFIIFGKRPDAGGTTFLASEETWMVDELLPGEHIVHFNNEEAGNKVRSRIMQARLGWTTAEMDADPQATFKAYADSLPDPQMIKVYDKPQLTTSEIEDVLAKYKPRLVVMDQLWKVKGFERNGEDHDRLMGLFSWAREMAKTFAPVIAVHQLGEKADGLKWVGYEHLYGSKTGIQGEADLIITMSRLYENGNRRYFFLPKNKLKTPGDEAFRNGKFTVEIQPEIARYRDTT
jgi:hypothetical protein